MRFSSEYHFKTYYTNPFFMLIFLKIVCKMLGSRVEEVGPVFLTNFFSNLLATVGKTNKKGVPHS